MRKGDRAVGEGTGRPLVSVVLPVYNMERFVVESVESILGQTLQDFELVIINDGSTDHTEDKLRPYLDHPKVIYRVQDNRGAASALNHGIRFSRGQYIAIQNADDISLPTRLEEQAEVLEHDPDVEMVYSRVIVIHGDDQLPAFWGGRVGNLSREQTFYKLYTEGSFIPYPVMFRQRHLAGQDPFPERYKICCDYVHHLRVTHDYRICAIDHPLVILRKGESHDHLMRHYELMFSELRTILNEIYIEYRDQSPRVTKAWYTRAMSNHYLLEANVLLEKRRYGMAARRFFDAFSYRPLNPKALWLLLKMPVKLVIPAPARAHLRALLGWGYNTSEGLKSPDGTIGQALRKLVG